MQERVIRNFCIIAHIDHGKSTLADRLLELTGTVEKRNMKAQLLDQMDLERERGITIKLAPVRMNYKDVELNLIDTPGHVDFSYEVSRSLEACEGAILVVDATQGIQAQTLANVYLALAADLTIVPAINKIDLAAADVAKTTDELINLLGCTKEDIMLISAKTGDGVEQLLERVIEKVPPPKGNPASPLRALIFDSYYDDYRGVITYVRVVDGRLETGDSLQMMASTALTIALELGSLNPGFAPRKSLESGEIGYIVTNLRTSREARVGDTVTSKKQPASVKLPGYVDIHPFVYAGFFPSSNENYQLLKDGMEKLSLSDSALQFSPESSPVLGHGFRAGFLGLLHLDVVRERLEREYDLDLVITNPSTDYQLKLTDFSEVTIQSAADLPDVSTITEIREPWIKGEIVCPKEFVGQVIQLVVARRGLQKNIHYVDNQLAVIDFEAPLSNLLTDFYDALKSSTSGYGSFNYELADYRPGDLVRIDFYIAGDMMEALSVIVHRSESIVVGRDIVAKLKEIIPRQQFQVSLQAAIGGKFIAREDVSAYRKDVTGYLYGGDVSRKKKLLAKQKKGKQKMKRFGKVDMPSDAFTVMLKRS
jgi:GTP-binding protein LepA